MSTERNDRRDSAAIEEVASAWLIRRDSGVWSEDDQARLTAWLEASSLHRVAFLRLEASWEEAARLKALGAGIPGDRPPPRGTWNLTAFYEPDQSAPQGSGEARESPDGSRQGRSRLLAFTAAAALVVAMGTGLFVWLGMGGPEDHRTAVGRIESFSLRDGSKVMLNTDSEIRVQLGEAERHIELVRGEAFFEVAKDPRHPFVVRVGDKRVIAVGTQFSVRRESNDAEVVVTEGQVRVEADGGAGRGPDTLLTPGSIARAGDAGVLVHRESVAQASERLSWRTGTLMFRDETLADAVAEFNRYNVRQIVIADPSVAALKIEGNFRATNVDAFVRLLSEGFPVQASSEGDRIVLTAPRSVTPQ